MAISRFPQFIRDNYEIHEWRHASAILENDFPGEWQDLVDLSTDFRLYTDDITVPGGRKSRVSVAIDRVLNAREWREKGFHARVVVDGREGINPTHKIDDRGQPATVQVASETT